MKKFNEEALLSIEEVNEEELKKLTGATKEIIVVDPNKTDMCGGCISFCTENNSCRCEEM